MSLYKTIQESDARLADGENLCLETVVAQPVRVEKLHKGGRNNGDTNISPLFRTLIGAAAELDDNNAQTAKAFGVSDRAVANYRKGRTSHDSAIVPASKTAVAEAVSTGEDRRAEAKSKAIDRLASLFDGPISTENLSTLKPREAISAAKDLATVIDRVTPKDANTDNRVQFVVFAPRQRVEAEYETVDINAREVE